MTPDEFVADGIAGGWITPLYRQLYPDPATGIIESALADMISGHVRKERESCRKALVQAILFSNSGTCHCAAMVDDVMSARDLSPPVNG